MESSRLSFRLFVVAATFASAPLFAQSAATPYPVAPGNTSLMLNWDFRGGITAPANGSRVSVPPGERVVLNIPDGWDASVQWMRDGQPIVGATGTKYVITAARTSDTGTYTIAGRSQVFVALPVALTVAPPSSVANFSTLLLLPPHASGTVGFVIEGAKPKKFLIRAVGPSLRTFGISSPAPQLQLLVFDSHRNELPTTTGSAATDWAAIFNSVGAFALSAAGGDFYCTLTLPAGAYTAQLSDDSGTGGTALFECYELP